MGTKPSTGCRRPRLGFYAGRYPELREFSVAELQADLRLYRVTVTAAWTLVGYRAPENTTGIDERHPIWVDDQNHAV
jgi:hypothetical protein